MAAKATMIRIQRWEGRVNKIKWQLAEYEETKKRAVGAKKYHAPQDPEAHAPPAAPVPSAQEDSDVKVLTKNF
jgi:cysteine synthase